MVGRHHAAPVEADACDARSVRPVRVQVGDHLAAVTGDGSRARHAGAEHAAALAADTALEFRHREADVSVARVVGVGLTTDVDDAGCAAETGPGAADGA